MEEDCRYCGGNCPNEPDDSEYLCDGFAPEAFDNNKEKRQVLIEDLKGELNA